MCGNAVSKETEYGFIIISLSDNQLGSIFLMNQIACKMFKYSKRDILGRNVSTIMPVVIGEKHDSILKEFLNRHQKSFNTDQRLIYGKDTNGFLFPMQLELSRASFSANDECIFIARVKPDRLKSTPISCLVGLNGEIMEHSAGFRHIFYRNSGKNSQNRTIEELIPTFFEEVNEIETVPVEIVVEMNNMMLDDVSATFSVAPLLVKG